MIGKTALELLLASLVVTGCAPRPCTGAGAPGAGELRTQDGIDQRSYQLGVIGAFCEVVSLGVKRLALSSPMEPREVDALIDEAQRIARENGVEIYREESFLVTDLFPESITEGKHGLLIYRGQVKDEYLALEEEKRALEREGKYSGEARKEIARKLGRLLSYPEGRIEEMLR